MIIQKIKAKSFAKKGKIDSWWWAEASMNPYRGCFHDCKYCDGKAESYHIHEDFATRIQGKINSPFLLDQFYKKLGHFPINRKKTSTLVDFIPDSKLSLGLNQPGKFISCVGGGVCDVYQPAEKKLTITQKLLQVVHDYNFPLFVLTKSKLVLRDLNLLKKINESSYANIGVTITLADENDQKIIEPRASSTQDRFETIEKLRKEGVHSGILFLPVLPWIGDTDENMDKIFREAKKVQAEYMLVGGMTLKPGRNKKEFLKMIKLYYPDLLDSYIKLYSNENQYGQPDEAKIKLLGLENATVKAYEYSKKYKIPIRMPRYIPEGRIITNLRISTLLFNIAFYKTLHSPIWPNTYLFHKAAQFIDSYEIDMQELTKKKINNLQLPKNVLPYVYEILESGKSRFLENIGVTDYLYTK
ncbi:MAG: radical SAM protein [Candidatus Hodarchaeales archaeon]|jgi:DNA repair photolyase